MESLWPRALGKMTQQVFEAGIPQADHFYIACQANLKRLARLSRRMPRYLNLDFCGIRKMSCIYPCLFCQSLLRKFLGQPQFLQFNPYRFSWGYLGVLLLLLHLCCLAYFRQGVQHFHIVGCGVHALLLHFYGLKILWLKVVCLEF